MLVIDMEIPHPHTERYLKNLLSPSDKIEFEALMEEHPQLAEDVANEKLAMEAIDHLIAQDLKSSLINTPREGAIIKDIKRPFNQKWAIAASLLILVAAVSFIFTNKENLNIDQYASNHIEIVEKEVAVKGDNSGLSIHPTREEFVEAQLLFQKGKFEEALNVYRSVYNSSDMSPEDKDITDWNVIMCHLKLKNVSEAKLLLQKIIQDENHYYFDESKDLIDKL